MVKAYIIGDYDEEIDEAVNLLESKGAIVIAKEVSNQEQLIKEVVTSIGKGPVLVLSRDPLKVSMSLNKVPNINAAPCSSASDVENAAKNNANVIIINDLSKKEEIISSIIGKHVEEKEEKEEIKPKPRRTRLPKSEQKGKEEQKAIEGEEEENKESQDTGQSEEAKNVEESEEKGNEGREEEEKERRKGFIGSIKDALGIVDKKEGG